MASLVVVGVLCSISWRAEAVQIYHIVLPRKAYYNIYSPQVASHCFSEDTSAEVAEITTYYVGSEEVCMY